MKLETRSYDDLDTVKGLHTKVEALEHLQHSTSLKSCVGMCLEGIMTEQVNAAKAWSRVIC
eukprot:scaffold324778_cov149-Cyclotella_meneghiniana.AAC.1